MKTDCYHCQHRRRIPGEEHIKCAKPDPDMTGNDYGIRSGWFFYPYNFDPIWRTKECVNYTEEDNHGSSKGATDSEQQ
jgi:hypothetical protein